MAFEGRMLLPSCDKMGAEVQEDARRAGGGRHRRGHGEGVNNLGRGGGVFGIDLVEEVHNITEEGVGMMDGEAGMEAVEAGVVGSSTKERQADVPAHEQVTGKMPFELAIRTGVGPGADEFCEDEGANGKGGRRAGSRGMIVVATDSDDGGGVVEVGQANEWMAGTLEEHGLIHECTDPGEDEGEKAVEESLDGLGEVRKCGRWVSG